VIVVAWPNYKIGGGEAGHRNEQESALCRAELMSASILHGRPVRSTRLQNASNLLYEGRISSVLKSEWRTASLPIDDREPYSSSTPKARDSPHVDLHFCDGAIHSSSVIEIRLHFQAGASLRLLAGQTLIIYEAANLLSKRAANLLVTQLVSVTACQCTYSIDAHCRE